MVWDLELGIWNLLAAAYETRRRFAHRQASGLLNSRDGCLPLPAILSEPLSLIRVIGAKPMDHCAAGGIERRSDLGSRPIFEERHGGRPSIYRAAIDAQRFRERRRG